MPQLRELHLVTVDTPPAPAHLQFRQLGRALRLKSDLQQVVVTTQWETYAVNNARRRSRAECDEEELLEDVAGIILDKAFWTSLIHVLKVASPITALLFATDNQAKELMGKIYYRMFDIGQRLNDMATEIPWASVAAMHHAQRWEYLHSSMHAAGYALDPEYLYTGDGGALDRATMEGLIETVERLSLRHVIQQALDPVAAARQLTPGSRQVQAHASVCMQQFASFRAKEKILTKGMVIQGAKDLPPSQWWSTYCCHIPELQSVACSVPKQPVSACAAQQSATGLYKTR